MPPLPLMLLMLTMLGDATQSDESPQGQDCSTSSSLDLTVKPMGQAATVCITPERTTTLVFNVPLSAAAVELQPTSGSIGVAQGDDFVTFYPKRSLLHGERVKVTVRFSDGAAPMSESFWLMGHVARGARQVEVLRHPWSADMLAKRAAASQADARLCQEENARLRSERENPGGLLNVAWMETHGSIAISQKALAMKLLPGSALVLDRTRSYSQSGRFAMSLNFINPGTESWTAEGAVLTNATGEDVKVLLWQDAAIPPNSRTGFVLVGTERPLEDLGCPCVLKLWAKGGRRSVTLSQVTFPATGTGTHEGK